MSPIRIFLLLHLSAEKPGRAGGELQLCLPQLPLLILPQDHDPSYHIPLAEDRADDLLGTAVILLPGDPDEPFLSL